MRYTDIAIIGGGLAGSTAAAMLGRAGIPAVLIDPRPVYPPDFRVEKLTRHKQVERFRKTGIAEAVLRAATHDDRELDRALRLSARPQAGRAISASCTTR